ncbi:MAG: metallophosphoesterase [Gemmatimonadaceae bacterium]
MTNAGVTATNPVVMKLNVLSDLHLSLGALEIPENDADAVILAGDISRPKEAASWASGFVKPVLYVPGNHEFYGSSTTGTVDELKRLCAGTNIRVLDNDEVIVEGVRFLGTTLWTDFMLFGERENGRRQCRKRCASCATSAESASAKRRTRYSPPLPRQRCSIFTPHGSNASWPKPHAGPTVVITHHAPSRNSIHPKFAGSLLNACFVSDAERLIDGSRARLWIHGHTHDSFDYLLNGMRVVCNPRGYAKDGVNENPLFDANFLVEIE